MKGLGEGKTSYVLKRIGHCTEWCAKSLYKQFASVHFTADRGPNASAGGKEVRLQERTNLKQGSFGA